jgi:hypothetical protein
MDIIPVATVTNAHWESKLSKLVGLARYGRDSVIKKILKHPEINLNNLLVNNNLDLSPMEGPGLGDGRTENHHQLHAVADSP